MEDDSSTYEVKGSEQSTDLDTPSWLGSLPGFEACGTLGMTDAVKYTHQSLDRKGNQIRLIQILPTGEDDALSCRTCVRNLSSQLEFVAISYAWGSPPSSHAIELDCKEFLVRTNLWRFLQHAKRHRDLKGEWLWVDAICIDQNNFNERTHQVSLIPQIYHSASKVVAWLGPAYGESDLAMHFLSTSSFKTLKKAGTHSIWSHASGKAMSELCARAYWTRLWVFQELLLSRQAYMMCGDKLIAMKPFQNLLNSVSAAKFCRPRTTDRLAYRNTVDSPAVMISKQISREVGERSLLSLIIATGNLRCADFRDKVYALLGVAAAGGHTQIVADYSVPCIQILISRVLQEHYSIMNPHSLDDVHEHLHALSRSFEIDYKTAIKLRNHYDGGFELPSEFDFSRVSLLSAPKVEFFLWAAFYNHANVLRLVLDDDSYLEEIEDALSQATEISEVSVAKVFIEVDSKFAYLAPRDKAKLLVDAAELGCRDLVEMLILVGNVGVNETWKDHTPLQAASKAGRVQVVEFLLTCAGVGLNYARDGGQTALVMACDRGHLEVVQILLATDAVELNGPQNDLPPLYVAAREQHPEIVKAILKTNRADVNIRSGLNNFTALIIASTLGNLEIVELLLSYTGIDVNIQTDSRTTALHSALDTDNPEIAQVLLTDGRVDINALGMQRQTALYTASKKGYLEIVMLLLRQEEIDINLGDFYNVTPLAAASEEGHVNVVRVLLKRKELNVNCEIYKGRTALICASRNGHSEVVRALLMNGEINVNHQDHERMTALIEACQYRHEDVVHALLARSDIDLNHKGRKGYTALHRAGDIGIIRALLERGADVNIQGNSLRTPLHYALKLKFLEKARLLLNAGRHDLDLRDVEGESVLDVACAADNLEAVELLMKQPNFNVNNEYADGITADDLAHQIRSNL